MAAGGTYIQQARQSTAHMGWMDEGKAREPGVITMAMARPNKKGALHGMAWGEEAD